MSLLNQWKNRPKENEGYSPIEKAPEQDAYPLSRGQQRLYFLDILYPNNPVYNSSEAYTFKGPLDVENLEESLQIIVKTNSVLRCSFQFINGEPIQEINNELELKVSKFDLSNLPILDKKEKQEKILKTDSLKPFDLSKPPLIRASILKIDDEEYILFVTIHHIITDKWSIGLFQEQLSKYYKKKPTVEELEIYKSKLQFTDYAYWQHKSPIDPTQLEYWKQKLSGEIAHLELPIDYPQTASPSFKGGSNVQCLSKGLSSKVLKLSKELDTTPYMLLLSVYYVMLFRYSNQNDILVGSPISVRGSKALEDIIGFFDETIVLRTSVSRELSFHQLVKTVRTTVMEAFSNKEVPFDMLVKELRPERSIATNPFFRTMFIYHAVEKTIFDPEIDMAYAFYNTGIAKFDLTLYISNEEGLLSTEFEYAKDLFDTESIDRFQKHFRLLLEGVTSDSSLKINELYMLTQEEELLLEPKVLGVETPYSRYTSIHEIIIDQAKKNPNSKAIVFENESITYEDFDKRSDVVAKQILQYSKGENQIVGLSLDRSIKMMIGLLGILKAGCAYLPLDLNYPKKRIDFVLQDSGVKILLTEKKYRSNFEGFSGNQIVLDSQETENFESDLSLPKVDKNRLAYVIYTSGSTGKPKGVPISHANIISSTESRLDFYPENPSAFLLMSSIAFDSSKAGVFWTLCTGGTLVISKERLEQDIKELSRVIHSNAISHTLMLPSLYKMVLDFSNVRHLESLNLVIVAGEECTSLIGQEHFKKLPKTELYNEYGPTEATVWCIAHKIEKDTSDSIVPIGKAISNAEVYLLNSFCEAVPFGAIGEIYIGGSGLSKSYLNRPELTNSVYVPHPFSKEQKNVLYKTGDLGKYKNDGTIEFLGRTDHQVKVRGFRIELSEIENALLNNDAIREAIVIAESMGVESEKRETKRLVAYVISKNTIDVKSVKSDLTSEIPSYMIPASIIELDKFPELPNGKVDKIALKEFGQTFRSKSETIKPTNEIESKLVKIWEEVLNQSNIGISDNYFEIGGDSMTSIKMFWLIENSMKVKLAPSSLFTNPTIAEIAKKIESDTIINTENFKYVIPYRIEGTRHPIFCIHGGEGHVLFYKNLATHIDANRPVYLVQPKGADGDDELHDSIEQMAEEYLIEILQVSDEDSINLVFYCCGALVVEIAKQLKAVGKTANIIIVDSSPKYIENDAIEENDGRFTYYFKRVLNTPFRTVQKSIIYRYRRYILPFYVSMLRDTYAKRHIKIRNRLEEVQNEYEWSKFDSRCTLIIGTDGIVDFDKKDITSWNYWCQPEITVCYSPGNHFNIFDEPQVESLGAIVEDACL